MKREREIDSIFCAAAEIASEEERRAFVRGACGDDSELAQRVGQLLDAHFNGSSILDSPAADGSLTLVEAVVEEPGDTIGRYRLLQKIGEGGMGVVFMAEQTEPVRRRVALKIIKPGMDSEQVIARFEAERQALAMMDHPNIARVFDAGTNDQGRPYFVMELVKGIPLTQYCDAKHLTPRERLELFIPVCQAVQHAHQKGIIHRDLKPSNVLVAEYDHRIVPKIIDFGVAKALNQSLTDRTLFTRFGEILGTFEYMSPEQAKLNQLDIDTRSDIYSLGVLLYELLAGITPFDKTRLQSSGLEEVLKMIREEEPPKPSTRVHSSATLSFVAASRNTEAKKLSGLIRGDLDWIVMKAMAKERNERYQTAEALVEDIQRHLDHQPIEAHRPSLAGRMRRLVRRHRIPVALTSVTALAVIIAASLGIVAYTGRLEQREQALLLREAEAQKQRVSWARLTAMPAIEQLLKDGHPVQAFRLAQEVRPVLPNDPSFQKLWDHLTVTVTFDLSPPGTKVFIRDWDGAADDWLEVGETPLRDVTLPNGDLRFRYVKAGFITREFDRDFPEFLGYDGPVSMKEDPGVPDGMVFIDGVRSAFWNRLPADLGDFLIDRYEVSNAEFQKFLDAGGYEKPEFWEGLEFTRNGKSVSWHDAVLSFRDRSGRFGPATWRNGKFPEGRAGYPVSGVSWFEAAAYAKFVGRELPTIYHWQWAADGIPGHMISLGNFSGQGPAPRGADPGIGRFDVYDLAGNVKEWCRNADLEGHRCLRGGAWNEAGYRFGFIDVASPWDRSETHGFRCVRYLADQAAPPEAIEPWRPGSPHLTESRRLPFQSLEPWFRYDSDLPLNPKVIKTEEPDSRDWRHEIVRIDAAYGHERFDVHLFIPRGNRKKYETVLFAPGLGAMLSKRFVLGAALEDDLIPQFVDSGRIVCLPICKGMYERGDGEWPKPTVQDRDDLISAVKDLARTVDYLHTRTDTDSDRLIFLGYSSSAVFLGPIVLAVHPEFRAGVLVAGGYVSERLMPPQLIVNPFHFTPHVKLPVVMINGFLDTIFPYQNAQIPFFEDLGSANKKHVMLEAGHNPPTQEVFAKADQWLRELLGKSVTRTH